MESAFLKKTIAELKTRYKCHTFILYGSRARGDFTEKSDWGLLAIRPAGEGFREAKVVDGQYLDVWIYSEKIKSIPHEFLHIRGGKVIEQKSDIGTLFLEQVDKIFKNGPSTLPQWDRDLRISWSEKMLDRIESNGIEGRFRSHELLHQLLEDYFRVQDQWNPGPKEAFKWMKNHDPHFFELFDEALKPGASFKSIQNLTKEIQKLKPKSKKHEKAPQVGPIIRTERLIMRLPTRDDIPEILKYYTENKEHFEPTDPIKPDNYYSQEYWQEKIKIYEDEFISKSGFRCFAFNRENPEEIVAFASFTQFSFGSFYDCFLGYSVGKKYEGKGLAFETVSAAIKYVFEEINMHRITANHLVDNHRSAKLLKRLGFEVEGHGKEYLFINGAWRDHVMNALINKNWKNPNA